MKKTLCQVALIVGLCSAVSALAGPGLADGASKFVGNITTGGQVRSDFGTYWNQITAENECKWASIEGTRGQYNFSGCDRAYNWAKNNGGHFKFHALVWGSQYPSWLNGLSVEDTKTAITAWFDAVKKQYPEIEMIDVVNEAIRTRTNSYHSGYGNGNNIIGALGGDNNGDYNFVTTAFKMARERWPNAILIYNDYNTFQWQKNEGIDLINTIKKNGAPVDAYGLQAHDMMTQGGGAGGTGGGGACLDQATFKSILYEIHEKTQLPLFISEYDIATSDDNVQKQCYQEQITEFMNAEFVAGITLWGYIYGQTWTTDGNSGIIKDGVDRPAMTWLKEFLASNKGVNTTGLGGGGGITSPSTVRVEEQTIAVTELTSTFEGSVSFAIDGGDDASLFELSGTNLAFKYAPSFASPDDKDKDNVYKIKVKVTSGDKSASLEMSVIVTQKQANFNGSTITLPAKIEAEAYDVCGEECAYHDSDTENEGGTTLRDGDGVDVVQIGTGSEYAIGYTNVGEWLEYTVNVENEVVYKLIARVASGSENSSFRFFIDDQAITDTIKVTAGEDWDTYSNVEVNTTKLTKGTHVIKLVITGSYVNIDWFELNDGTNSIENSLRYNVSNVKTYRIYNLKGANMGTFNASDMTSLKNEVKKLNVKAGPYLVRSVDGQVNQMIQINK